MLNLALDTTLAGRRTQNALTAESLAISNVAVLPLHAVLPSVPQRSVRGHAAGLWGGAGSSTV